MPDRDQRFRVFIEYGQLGNPSQVATDLAKVRTEMERIQKLQGGGAGTSGGTHGTSTSSPSYGGTPHAHSGPTPPGGVPQAPGSVGRPPIGNLGVTPGGHSGAGGMLKSASNATYMLGMGAMYSGIPGTQPISAAGNALNGILMMGEGVKALSASLPLLAFTGAAVSIAAIGTIAISTAYSLRQLTTTIRDMAALSGQSFGQTNATFNAFSGVMGAGGATSMMGAIAQRQGTMSPQSIALQMAMAKSIKPGGFNRFIQDPLAQFGMTLKKPGTGFGEEGWLSPEEFVQQAMPRMQAMTPQTRATFLQRNGELLGGAGNGMTMFDQWQRGTAAGQSPTQIMAKMKETGLLGPQLTEEDKQRAEELNQEINILNLQMARLTTSIGKITVPLETIALKLANAVGSGGGGGAGGGLFPNPGGPANTANFPSMFASFFQHFVNPFSGSNPGSQLLAGAASSMNLSPNSIAHWFLHGFDSSGGDTTKGENQGGDVDPRVAAMRRRNSGGGSGGGPGGGMFGMFGGNAGTVAQTVQLYQKLSMDLMPKMRGELNQENPLLLQFQLLWQRLPIFLNQSALAAELSGAPFMGLASALAALLQSLRTVDFPSWGQAILTWGSSVATAFLNVTNTVKNFVWPPLPAFNWPDLPSFQWPKIPDFKWSVIPQITWPQIVPPVIPPVDLATWWDNLTIDWVSLIQTKPVLQTNTAAIPKIDLAAWYTDHASNWIATILPKTPLATGTPTVPPSDLATWWDNFTIDWISLILPKPVVQTNAPIVPHVDLDAWNVDFLLDWIKFILPKQPVAVNPPIVPKIDLAGWFGGFNLDWLLGAKGKTYNTATPTIPDPIPIISAWGQSFVNGWNNFVNGLHLNIPLPNIPGGGGGGGGGWSLFPGTPGAGGAGAWSMISGDYWWTPSGGQPLDYSQMDPNNIPMAMGGIVTGPTSILAGEAGPEAIIPLSRMNGGMGGQIINVNVSGQDFSDPHVAMKIAQLVGDTVAQNLRTMGLGRVR